MRLASAAIVLSLAIVALSALAARWGPPDWALLMTTGQQLAATIGGAVALLAVHRTAPPRQRWVTGALGLALALASTGLLVRRLLPATPATTVTPVVALFVLALAAASLALLRGFIRDLDTSRLGQIVLDGLVVVAATACLLTPAWYPPFMRAGGDVTIHVAVIVAILVVAAPVAGYLALIDRRLQPGAWGPYAALAGLLVSGLAWLAWLDLLGRGQEAPVMPVDWGYSVAVLLLAWGGATWNRPPAPRAGFERLAATLVDLLPMIAVGACVLVVIALNDGPEQAGALRGAAIVVALGLGRQWLLVRHARAAHEKERSAAARLAHEIRHRAMVLGALASFEGGPTPEATAARICERAIEVDGIAQAAIFVFEPDGSGLLLAEAGPVRTATTFSRTQPPHVAAAFRERAASGPWLESLERRADPHAIALRAAGLAWMADAPVMVGGRLLGILSLASPGAADDDLQAERLTTARELGLLAGVILGAALDERARIKATRASIVEIIDGWAFRTVFQPIVELTSGRTVGHEALTRFEDGFRPDLRFEEAARVGLGIPLEAATLESAIRSSARLPRDTYLSLNASPAFATDIEAIADLVRRAPCAVVLEITEHAAVESYPELRSSLGQLRRHVRIAVDDVGAGYAGLRHILEIEPDLLKLDIALVRAVDTDAAKRALIGSIVAFGLEAGCKVVAEGVETEAEARALRGLGVTMGQGYLFGRPVRIDQIAVDGWIDEVRGIG